MIFVGLLFSCAEFSDCMILISELFLKALKLFLMNISQFFFDSDENSLPPNLIQLFMFR